MESFEETAAVERRDSAETLATLSVMSEATSFLILHGIENHRPPEHWQFLLARAARRAPPRGALRGTS